MNGHAELCYCLHWQGHHRPVDGDYGACTRCTVCNRFSPTSRNSSHLFQRGMPARQTVVYRLATGDRMLASYGINGKIRPTDTKTGALVATVTTKIKEGNRWTMMTDLGPTVDLYGDTEIIVVKGRR